jgi:hypothetical protein
MYYFPIHRWLHILVMLNLVASLVVTTNVSNNYHDMASGSWFGEFLARTPEGYTPLALDVYYDHWGVSNSGKLGGLYFSVGNLPPELLMKPDNKFVLCLVPTGVNVQDILRLVLNDFIFYQGKFSITIGGVVYMLYCEIARIIGDIPGLAELCAVLNHRANCPCIKCRVPSSKLQKYTKKYKTKSQEQMKKIWRKNLPKLANKGKRTGKTVARAELKRYGLKAIRCAWLLIPNSHHFDYVTHSVSCLLHNEELGLMLLEITKFLEYFEQVDRVEIVKKAMKMPHIPGLPHFKAGWFDCLANLLGKEVLTISKIVLYATYKLCEGKGDLLNRWNCLRDHVQYFNMLGQALLPKVLLTRLHQQVLDHHLLFKSLYLMDAEESTILKPHVGLHWTLDIKMWGMPIYYSTNHWEPKHKQLKLLKLHQTNNHNHSRDVLEREWVKQVERSLHWQPNPVVSHASAFSNVDCLQKYQTCKKSLQVLFCQAITAEVLHELQSLILAVFDIMQLMVLKYVVAFHFKITVGTNIMIEGGNNQLWFGKVTQVVGYFVNGHLYNVYLKVDWYIPQSDLTTDSEEQYSFFNAAVGSSWDFVPLSSCICKVLVTDMILSDNTTTHPLIIDACYYLRKWHSDDSEELCDSDDSDDGEKHNE